MGEFDDLSKTQIQRYRMLFSIIDKDCDDKITMDDLKSTFKDLNLDIKGSKDMLEESKSLDFNQFVTLLVSKFSGFSEESELGDAFATFLENDIVNSKSLKDSVASTVIDDVDKKAVSDVVDEFTKKNNVTGVTKFKTEEFIEKIK